MQLLIACKSILPGWQRALASIAMGMRQTSGALCAEQQMSLAWAYLFLVHRASLRNSQQLGMGLQELLIMLAPMSPTRHGHHTMRSLI